MKLLFGLFSFLLFNLLSIYNLNAQEKISTVGLQFKPIYSSPFFGTGPINLIDSGFTHQIKPGRGFSGGMVIRKGYKKNLSFEYGINYVVRNYNLKIESSGNLLIEDRFKIVGYEIPFSQLIFIKLSEKIFMNAAVGLCINMFPSDIARGNNNYVIEAGRNLLFNPSLLANLGVEYRTPKSGYFYFGTTLNRPFKEIYSFSIDYVKNNAVVNKVNGILSGAYLTFDIKYFFHEDPEKKVKRKAKTMNKEKK
jgi:hypothetical protein